MSAPDPIKYEILPEHLRAGMTRYVEHGIRPGSFLCAILSGDLYDAYSRGDATCIEAMPRIVYFVMTELPSKCYGSSEKMEAYLQATFRASMPRPAL